MMCVVMSDMVLRGWGKVQDSEVVGQLNCLGWKEKLTCATLLSSPLK